MGLAHRPKVMLYQVYFTFNLLVVGMNIMSQMHLIYLSVLSCLIQIASGAAHFENFTVSDIFVTTLCLKNFPPCNWLQRCQFLIDFHNFFIA